MLWRHRFITDTWGWEIPAGRIDPGETLERRPTRDDRGDRLAAARPRAPRLRHPTNGLMDQRFNYFVARGAEHVGEFDRTETESIAWFAPEDVRTLIEQGEVPDGLSLTALGLAFALRPALARPGGARR